MTTCGFSNGVLYSTNVDFTGNALVSSQVVADGQLLIGSTVFPNIVASTLTPGPGIAITNGSGSITISTSGSGFTWNPVTAATNPNTLVAENGYVPGGGAQVVFVLPAAPAFGDVIEIVGTAAGNLWTITQNAGQSIRLGTQSTAVGVLGHLDATMVTDSIKILCVVALTTFEIISITGNPSFN